MTCCSADGPEDGQRQQADEPLKSFWLRHLRSFQLEATELADDSIANVHEQTLYKLDRSKVYEHLDPILKGTIKTHVVREVWDEVVRVMASIQTGTATASLILHRLGSYARQNRVHQALAEIGRAEKTMHILRTARRERGVSLRPGAGAEQGRGVQ